MMPLRPRLPDGLIRTELDSDRRLQRTAGEKGKMKVREIVPALVAALVLWPPAWAQQSQPQTQPRLGGAATPIQPISNLANSGSDEGAVPVARGLLVGYEPDNANGSTQNAPDD